MDCRCRPPRGDRVSGPATAVAQTATPVVTSHIFQILSLTGSLAPGGACGPGLLGAAAVPSRPHSSIDSAGNTLFGMQFDAIGLTSTPATGTATLGWFNLTTFQGGLTTFPINALTSTAIGIGAASPPTPATEKPSRSSCSTSPDPGRPAAGHRASAWSPPRKRQQREYRPDVVHPDTRPAPGPCSEYDCPGVNVHTVAAATCKRNGAPSQLPP